MKLVYTADECLTPFRIWQYSKHFEIFVYQDIKKNKCFYFDFSKLLDILEFKKRFRIEVERIAFNDGSRTFHFYILGCLIAYAKTKSVLPKCEISADRSKLEVKIKEIDLFDV